MGGVALIVLGILAWPVLFQRADSGEVGQDFNQQFSSAYEQLNDAYLQPVEKALQEARSSCSSNLDPNRTDCGQLVQTITNCDPALGVFIDRLGQLLVSIPDASPALLQPQESILVAMRQLQQADHLIIDAWANVNASEWTDGWGLWEQSLANQLTASATPAASP